MSSVVVAAGEPLSAQLPEEVVILNPADGIYYGLEGVGARIWELVADPISVRDLHRTLIAEYEVDADRLEADLLKLLRSLAKQGLLKVASDQSRI